MNELILSLENACISDANSENFAPLSLTIKQNEHWLLAGENEALKNALLMAIAGSARIVQGKITYHFFEKLKPGLTDAPFRSATHFIASVSSRHAFRDLSNTRNFYYQQRFNSTDSENSEKVFSYLQAQENNFPHHNYTINQLIQKLRLENLLEEELIKLSNGETRRVLIAAALMKQPQILLLSNPFTGLDAASRIEISQFISEIAASGITIIMSGNGKEIPDCITNVAVAETNNNLRCVKKENFSPDNNIKETTSPSQIEGEYKFLPKVPQEKFEFVVQMRNVQVRYANKFLLNKINWEIRQGERWALTGPNGAGKSTLLSLIYGDHPQAYANDIILFGKKRGSGESIWDIKKKIGFFSPELYQYFPLENTCMATVESGFYGTSGLFRPSHPQLASASMKWLKIFKLEHLAEKNLLQLTPVQQRLCLLARALVQEPPLLILDEPCQGFDEAQIKWFSSLINRMCLQLNTTLIYVSHYQNELPSCITHFYQLEQGKAVFDLK